MIKHIFVHDHRRKPAVRVTRDDPRGPVTKRAVQYRPSWGSYGSVLIPAGTPVKKVGGDWAVASVSEAARFLAGGGSANSMTRHDAEHYYLFVPADAVGTNDRKTTDSRWLHMGAEAKRKGKAVYEARRMVEEELDKELGDKTSTAAYHAEKEFWRGYESVSKDASPITRHLYRGYEIQVHNHNGKAFVAKPGGQPLSGHDYESLAEAKKSIDDIHEAAQKKTSDAGVLKHVEVLGNATVKVYWDASLKEFTCRLFVDGRENVNASYFTDDIEDAKNTAKDMARRAKTKDRRASARDGYADVDNYDDWETEVFARWPGARISGGVASAQAMVKENGRDAVAGRWDGKKGWVKTD